jgi:hypothetical protein
MEPDRDEENEAMIRVVCGCGRVFKAEDRHSGKRTRCPVCGTGLTIGQTPTSSASEGDLDEMPSWWFPSDPNGLGDPGAAISDSADPDSVRTEILPPPEPAIAMDPKGDDMQAHLQPAAAKKGRSLAVLSGTAAILALLAAGGLWWIRAVLPGREPAQETREPADIRTDVRGTLVAGPPDGGTRPRGDAVAAPEGRAGSSRPASRLRLLVPAYIYPAGEGRKQWRRLIDAAARVDVVAVVNPRSGPGLERNPDYASVIADAAVHGVQLVGYVDLAFGDRSLPQIKGDIDAWVRFYPRIHGFFLDQQPRDATHSALIAEIGTYAREKLKPRDALIIGDPGLACDDSYLSRRAVDAVCVFTRADGFATFEVPANLKPFDSFQLAALPYQVADAEAMHALLKEAIVKRIGYIFVTDGKLPNPWAGLPAYWEDEVDFIARIR